MSVQHTDGLQGRSPQKPLQTTLGNHGTDPLAVVLVAPEPRPVREVGDKVCGVDGNESPRDSEYPEVPLLVHRLETLKESEDQGVGETRQQGQTQDNGLGEQHDPWAHPDSLQFLGRDTRLLQLVRSVDVRILARLASALGFLVENDGRTGFGHEEMNRLSATVEDKLNPEVPTPVEDCILVSIVVAVE